MLTNSYIPTALLRLCMVMAVLGTAACGLKSEPRQPDGSTYPLTYPALPEADVERTAVTKTKQPQTRTISRGATRDASGYYTPPPPATELLVK